MMAAELAEAPLRKLNRWLEVVLVDDEPRVLGSLRRLLRYEPYDLLTTSHPDVARQWIEDRDVSLLITDERMPEIDGHRLVEETWKHSPSTACVILTAYPVTTIRVPGLREGLHAIITKPWDDEMIRRTIRQLLYERELDDPWEMKGAE